MDETKDSIMKKNATYTINQATEKKCFYCGRDPNSLRPFFDSAKLLKQIEKQEQENKDAATSALNKYLNQLENLFDSTKSYRGDVTFDELREDLGKNRLAERIMPRYKELAFFAFNDSELEDVMDESDTIEDDEEDVDEDETDVEEEEEVDDDEENESIKSFLEIPDSLDPDDFHGYSIADVSINECQQTLNKLITQLKNKDYSRLKLFNPKLARDLKHPEELKTFIPDLKNHPIEIPPFATHHAKFYFDDKGKTLRKWDLAGRDNGFFHEEDFYVREYGWESVKDGIGAYAGSVTELNVIYYICPICSEAFRKASSAAYTTVYQNDGDYDD